MKVSLIIFILLSFVSVYSQTDEKETLKKLNQAINSSYQSGDLSEAQKNARQALDLSIKIFGNESLQTASVYSNLGIILRQKKEYEESIVNLQKAVDIYQKVSGATKQNLSEALELLAFSQMLDGKTDEAQANYLQAIEKIEEQFGKDSKESFSLLLNTAGFFTRSKNFERANEFYLRSYAVAVKNFGKQSKELEEIENSRACLFVPQNFTKNQKNYIEERKKILGENSDYGGIINFKTKKLPPPKYPSEARSQRLGGMIPVRVKVDEKGNVVEAKAICGSPILGRASEEAAREAKFEIVEVSGQPIKYSGILVYNFIP